MYRSSPARKYGPLALLAAAQLVVVLVAPSTAPTTQAADLAATGGLAVPGLAGDGGTAGVPGADGSVPGAGPAVPGTVGTGGTGTGGTGGTGSTGGTGGTGSTGGTGGTSGTGGTGGTGQTGSTVPGKGSAVTGDTSHCRGGRQFDPAIDYFAPPCVPGKPGATGVANGGATSTGVTGDTIRIIHYIPDYGATVNTILRAQGLYYDAPSAQKADDAYAKFINDHYQLYGRKVTISTFQGTCATVPPDLPCLIAEMDKVAAKKPFAVLWSTTVCSACFSELSRKGVVNWGGAGFSDEFRAALKPYNWDMGMSATRLSQTFANWYCGQMAGKPAIYAGDQNPAQDFRRTTRRLGVVSTNDPDNKRTIQKVLYPALAKCGVSVGKHEYFYAQDVSTAEQQSQAGTAVMNSPQDPATSVVCFCDPVAPQFSYEAAARNNYWPEVLFADNQALATDSTGQSYMSGIACETPQRGCSFDGALGISQGPQDKAAANLPGVKTFKAGGGTGTPVSPLVQEIFWENYEMMASLIQMAGPQLTPQSLSAAGPRLGSRGGGSTGEQLKSFASGTQSWTQDVRLVHWSKKRTSAYNGKAGAFVVDGGKRFESFPSANQPPVPTVDKRN